MGCDGIMQQDKRDNNKVTADITILGEKLFITGQSSVEYIEAVADFVNQKLSQLQHNYLKMPRNKIIVLGIMNLADELIKSYQQIEKICQEKDMLAIELEKSKEAFNLSEAKAQHLEEEYEELLLLLEQEG